MHFYAILKIDETNTRKPEKTFFYLIILLGIKKLHGEIFSPI